ncbi:MAG: AMP-binding protein [Rickettsiales bacterium]|jgi:acyl-[acyl-carrier-protein]-phospholipid O-acyltransferase/long-chain-fatty-acid--[acyl-carrier-protein] ligase|nr:AMP-binding protein [Rickettsiales bacterium]
MLEKWLLRPVLTALLKFFFKIDVRGLSHYHAAGDRVIIIANHQSFWDPFILAVMLPEKPAFAMNVFQAEKWYFRWIEKIVKLYKLDPTKPMTMKSLISDLREGGKVVIFPEGRITTTGGLMKTYDGTRLLIDKTDAMVLPVHFSGLEYSTFSKVGKLLKQRWFPKVHMTILPARKIPADQPIYDVMVHSAFAASNYERPLLDAILEAASWHGANHTIANDITRTGLTYRQLFTRCFILRDKLQPRLANQSNVGVLLPNAIGGVVVFTALHAMNKVPCMLNFSAGEANILHACRIACVRTVLTSRQFIEKAELQSVASALEKDHTVIYLEDFKPIVSLGDKLSALFKAFRPRAHLDEVLKKTKPGDVAVVLYTSGSEGTPKGVALSHMNILANIYQASAKLDLMPADRVFNALPIFHSFGLTVGMILPLVRGIHVFLYPSPLHYRIVPDLVYDTDSTIFVGTDTFMNGYARYAHPYDFHSVRLCVAGAEKLKEPTRRMWLDKFGVSILQGYGVTETSPVLSVNSHMQHKPGTVGKALPGIECKLEPVQGLEKGGRLYVKGVNVMLGYLKADQPGIIQPQGEWYDTGDIVDIDEDGYISILGRAKRFAKIGGEMVSLIAVEELAAQIYKEETHAAIAVSDPRKGEQVLLFTEAKELTREMIIAKAHELGVAEIFLPRQVQLIDEIPRLGNGKIDYQTLQKMAPDQRAG